MYSKSSTTTKLYSFGDVFMSICIILSVVLSNLVMQTTKVSADTGTNGSQEELTVDSAVVQPDHLLATDVEGGNRNSIEPHFDSLHVESDLLKKMQDHLSVNPFVGIGQYIENLGSTDVKEWTTQLLVDEEKVDEKINDNSAFFQLIGDCTETTETNGEGEEVTNLSVASGEICEINSNTILYDSILVEGMLKLSPEVTSQGINVYADVIEVASEAVIHATDVNSETTYYVDELIVNGEINANGSDEEDAGNITIVSNLLSGSGYIRAVGASVGRRDGGEIVLDIADNQFTGDVEAFGGFYSYVRGDPGTIYYVQEGRMIINNADNFSSYTFPEGEYSFSTIEIGGRLEVYFEGENTIINISDGIYSYEGQTYIVTPMLYVYGTIPEFADITVDGVDVVYDSGILDHECEINYLEYYDEYYLSVGEAETCWLAPGEYSANSISIMGIVYLATVSDNQEFIFNADSFSIHEGAKMRTVENSANVFVNSQRIYLRGRLDSGSKVQGNGGEVNLTITEYFSGSGIIKANGFSGESLGSGGKITINAMGTDDFTGDVQAYSGIDGTEVGTPGYIYYVNEGRIFINNNDLGGSITFPQGSYTYDRIELGNAVELTFDGAGTILTINDGFYGSGYSTPIVNLAGNLISSDELVVDNVILNWSGQPDFQYSVNISESEVQRNGYSESDITLNLTDNEGTPISRDDVYIRISGDGNELDGISIAADEWILFEESDTLGTYTVGLSSSVVGVKNIEFLIGETVLSNNYWVEFIELDLGSGLISEYYDNDLFEGTPCAVVYGEIIDFEIGDGWPNISPSECSSVEAIRWKGLTRLYSTMTYEFSSSSDKLNFWLDGEDMLGDNPTINFATGYHQIIAEISGLSEITSGVIDLQWSRNGYTPEVVPSWTLFYVYAGQSTISLSNDTVIADGEQTIEVTIQAKRDDGRIYTRTDEVFIKVDGPRNFLNGTLMPEDTWVSLGDLNDEGQVTGQIATTSSGTKEIQASIMGMLIQNTATLEAIQPDVYGFQILFDGEMPDPESDGGKTGEIIPLYKNDPVHIQLRAVDESYGLLEGVNGTASLSVNDVDAQYDATIIIEDGIGDAYIVWPDTGEQELSITGDGVLGELTVNDNASITDTLVIADGEMVYADDLRTYLTNNVSPSDLSIPVDNTEGFYPGHQILLIKMTGEDAGQHELLNISSVAENQLILENAATLSYPLNDGNTQVIVIPRIEQITIQSGGELTTNEWDGSTGGVLYLDINEINVESGGVVHADAAGFGQGEGPGAGIEHTAGGYGGEGASDSELVTDGKPYGTHFEPILLGSGGGAYCSYHGCDLYTQKYVYGGTGGGIVRIISNSIINNGTLSANGGIGGTVGSGSGGSLWITTNELSGSGSIQTIGGRGSMWGYLTYAGFSGGGGRIAIETNMNQYTGSVQAFGGPAGYATGVKRLLAGAGSIYWANENKLVIDNNNQGDSYWKSGLIPGDYDFDSIELVQEGSLKLFGEGENFNIGAANITGDGTAVLASEGDLVVNGPLTLSTYSLDVLGTISGATSLFIGSGQTFEMYAETPIHTGAYMIGNITVATDATLLLHNIDDEDGDYTDDMPVKLVSDNITVQDGGIVSLDGEGYETTTLTGNGPGGGLASNESMYAVGGAHGGKAGENPDGMVSAETYGDIESPVMMGSAGGTAGTPFQNPNNKGGNGGGALHLTVNNLLDLDGIITANGEAAEVPNTSEFEGTGGGGAGGSLWIEAGEIDGYGSITANGGDSEDSSGGGGGRLAVLTAGIDSDITLSAEGGTGNHAGEHGTIYLGAVDVNTSSCVADPTDVAIGGVAASDVLVTLVAGNGYAAPYKTIDVTLVNGSTAFIDGETIIINQTVSISETDINGELHFAVSATTYGTREFVISVDGNELPDHVVINFTSGDFEPAYSTLISEPQNVPADGVSTAVITATANNIDSLPIIDVEILMSADGNAVVTQPVDLTNEYGQAVGYIADSTIENVTIEAEAWGIPFLNATTVNFYGTDFVSTLNIPSRVIPGQDVSIGISVQNLEAYDVENVVVDLTIPELITYESDTSGITPVITDQIYSFTIAEMMADENIQFIVNGFVSETATDGDTISLVLSSSSNVTEINPADNTTQADIPVVQGYSFESSITPNEEVLYIGGEAEFAIAVKNTDLLADLYSISVTGLDSFDVELRETELVVNSGDSNEATLSIGTNVCITDPSVNFIATITSNQSGNVQELTGTVTIDSSPMITLNAPADNATSGSQSVLFNWITDPETAGTLTIYPTDNPDAVQTYSIDAGENHAIQVENLTRNTSYTWYVDAISTCGSSTSSERVLNIGNGIVFENHNQNLTINRDYDQRIEVAVKNTDTEPHTLTSSVINPYEDLIVNFVDSGSIDQTITLEPGETANLTLALHAQDAELHDYVLTANLIADDDTTPIIDNANLNVEVLFDGDFTIEENVAAYDPVTLAHTYVITNHGQTITDLSIKAIDPVTGLPASILLSPSFDHAKLETGESIEVVAYPIFTEEDAVNHIAYASTLKQAKAVMDSFTDISYYLYVDGSGATEWISDEASCGEGFQIYQVIIENCELDFESKDWYCTNKATISTEFDVPWFVKTEDLSDLNITMGFFPQGNTQKHDGKFFFNDVEFLMFENNIPDFSDTFDIPIDAWRESLDPTTKQVLRIETYHPNPGHYIVATGYNLHVGISSTSTYACAATPEDAKTAIEKMYPCGNTVKPVNYETDVNDNSTLASNVSKEHIHSLIDSLNIETNLSRCLHALCADPIDTKTGVFSFSTTDISFPTTVGTFAFQRSYSSGSVEQYSTVGYGWTHNHEERLIFPENSFGMEDYVIFRDHIGNQSLFKINTDGTFSPGPGVLAELDAITDGYQVNTYDGYTFTFNSIGMITALANSRGDTFTYIYDDEGILQRVSADNGTRYLDFSYNDDVRITSITDYTGRQVTFDYNSDGEMIHSTDLLDQEWVYEYDTNHHMTAVNDPTGVQTVSTDYDIKGRAYRQYDVNGDLMIRIVRHDDGTVTVYNADGDSETYSYDDRGIMVEKTDQADNGTNTTYDANFRPTSITNEIGSELTMEWSEDGKQLLAEVDPAGNRTEYTYDEDDNLISTTDPSGNTKTYTYDGDLLISSTDIEGKTTTYTYTAEGWLESQTDAYDKTTTYTYDAHGQLLTTTNWLGDTTSNIYDELGRPIESVDEQGRVNRNEYNVAGQLVRTIQNYDDTRPQNDENVYNLITEYTYDVYGNQKTVTDTLGNTTTYNYDNTGLLVSTVDALDNETSYSYDANGQLVKSTDALGRETTYVYDAAGRRLSTVNALGISSGTTTFDLTNNASTASDSEGNAATYYYNALNQVVRILDPMGHETTTTYNENGNVETKTDELGRVTTYEYDDLNRLVKTTDVSGAVTETVYNEDGNRTASIDALGHETTYTYDEMGRVVSTTDALGHTTSSDYDDDGKLVSTTDAMGRVTSYTYDEWGRKESMTDGAGRTTTYTYDELDRVISTSGPTGTTTTVYDALGRVVSRTDVRGHTTTTTYDDLGRVKTTTDYLGNTTTNYYDQVGNLLSSVDANGTISYEYDAVNRQIAVTDPLGNRSETVYDNLGNVSDTINAKGIVTHYVYDSLQRNVAIIQNYKPGEEADADTNVRVDYTYNAVGNRTYVNDANGYVTEFQYDAANRVTKKIDPIGNTWDYVYDLAGNLTSRIDGNGVTTNFVYDNGGNLLTIDYPDGEADVSFAYNNAGQRVSMTDGIGTSTWSYDDLSRVESVNDAYGNEIVYTYDVYGNRTGLQYADGKQVAYDFDTNNRLMEVASWDSLNTEYSYDTLGQLTNILRPNGVESTYEYDVLGRLTALDHSNDVTSLANYTYTYDELGNIIHAEENVMGGGAFGPTILVTVVDTTGEPLEGNTVYAYTGDEYSNYSKVTDEKGQVSITLPDGTYRFRVDVDGTQFWSGETDHCEIGACGQVTMTIPEAVLVTVIDSNNNYLAEQTVYAFEGETYSNHNGQTDENGQVSLRLPEGDYRFRTTVGGTQFWSAALEDEQCVVPGCTVDEILVTVPLVVTVQNDLGDPMVDLNVYAFNETTYANINGKTDENGQVELTLPEGEYRFRADYNGTQFWSADANHCAIPGCSEATVTVSLPVTVTVADTSGVLISGINVYAFDESTYQNFSKQTDENGEAIFTLPGGNYRFRADYNGTQFWSGSENTCEIPGCTIDAVTVTQPITVTVLDSNGAPQDGLNVYAFNGTTYANYSKQTNENGEAVFTLPLGDYRFRADLNGTQFWSGEENTCSLPDCGNDQVSVTISVEVMVLNGSAGAESVNVYAFNGTAYSGYSKTTGSDGVAIFTLPEGDYRFRADYAGEQIFSDVNNHCTIPGCDLISIQVGAEPTETPTVMPTETFTETPTVAFTETFTFTPVQTTAVPENTSTPVPENTNTPTLANSNTPVPEESDTPLPVETDTPEPENSSTPSQTPTLFGAYEPVRGFSRFLAKIRLAPLADDTGVSVTVLDSDGTPQNGLNVYAFDGSTYSGSSAVTNESGIASFTLAEGSYHFRADLNGIRFWSGEDNTCTTPSCVSDSVTVTKPLTITVVDSDGTAKSGLNVYAFNGTTYAGYSKVTNESGEAVFTLPEGDYRFRADLNGTRFWSGTENHCTLPGCESASVTVTKPLTVTVSNSVGTLQSGLNVYAFNGTTYSGYSKVTDENGAAVFTLPEGDYRFRADLNGTQFWSSAVNDCSLPGLESVDVSVSVPLTVSVVDSAGTPQSGIAVYAFNGDTYMNFSKTTNEYGQAVFTLPEGDYRFRADAGGTHYWSSETNDCTLPGCTAVTVSTSKPVSVTVVDSLGTPLVGLNVYAYDGTTYAGFSKVSDEYGNAVFYLPAGDYRFRADSGGTQFWSAETNTCTLPGCENVIISVTQPVTVTVVDTDGTAQAGLNVYAFDGETYSNYSKVTDEYGQAVFSLPAGDYHFRADLNGTQFWSADENTCTLPGCISDSVTVTKPVTVTVAGEEGNPYAELNVYAFNSETYAGYSGKTDAGGHVTFTLPKGDYHFRADYDGVQFWSNNENSCTVPGCEEDSVILPGGTGEQEVSIDYTYDALNRLISAEYSNGTAFGYTYDAAGNVLTYAETHYGQTTATSYTYDAANQLLTAVEDETVWQYSYDGNGSLIQTNPGASVANGSTRYTYNTAGYLTKVENYTTEWQTQSEMIYDGLGNRLEVTTYTEGEGSTTRYVLDGGAELTAIGAKNKTYYLYGLGAIGTLGESWSYMLQDGAGSIRQLVNEEGVVNLSVSYTPWGDTMEIYGSGNLDLGYLGGVYDTGSGLVYLGNGQYYDSSTGRFLTSGVNTAQENPYVPVNNDPAGMLIAPLALFALIFGRKKNRKRRDNILISILLILTLATSFVMIGENLITPVMANSANNGENYDSPVIPSQDNVFSAGQDTTANNVLPETIEPPSAPPLPDYCNESMIRDLIKIILSESGAVTATQMGEELAPFPLLIIPLLIPFGFWRDNDGVYHASRYSLIQQTGGFNDFYDEIFSIGSHMVREKYPFSYGDTDYILWAWKGDYLNLGAGAELGFYSREKDTYSLVDHYYAKRSVSLKMELMVIYNNTEVIVDYRPEKDQWWITGFNPYYQDVMPYELRALYVVYFDEQGMYDAFRNTFSTYSDPRWTFMPGEKAAVLDF